MIEEVVDTQYDAVNWGTMEIVIFKRAEGELASTIVARAAEQTAGLHAWLERQLDGCLGSRRPDQQQCEAQPAGRELPCAHEGHSHGSCPRQRVRCLGPLARTPWRGGSAGSAEATSRGLDQEGSVEQEQRRRGRTKRAGLRLEVAEVVG